MKRNLLFLLLSGLILANLTACTISGPSVRVRAPIEIEGGGHHDHGYGHCPPGQAKKGRC